MKLAKSIWNKHLESVPRHKARATVSGRILKNVLTILEELEMSANTKIRDAPRNSFSKKPRFEIYIPSAEMKCNKSKIPSVKIARYLPVSDFPEKA